MFISLCFFLYVYPFHFRLNSPPSSIWGHDYNSGDDSDPLLSAVQFEKAVLVRSEITRVSVLNIIEESWFKIANSVPKYILMSCESELRTVTSLIVLATIKRSADSDQSSRVSVDEMFRAADVNGDGTLTFPEWYDWLSRSSNKPVTSKGPTTSPFSTTTFAAVDLSSSSSSSSFPSSAVPVPALLSALKHVLGFAASTVNIAARSSSDPAQLVAAFVAGALATGYMDGAQSLVDALLNRLRPEVRGLVLLALTLEASSLSVDPRAVRRRLGGGGGPPSPPPSPSLPPPQAAQRRPSITIDTVDLASIPVLRAPDIDSPVDDMVNRYQGAGSIAGQTMGSTSGHTMGSTSGHTMGSTSGHTMGSTSGHTMGSTSGHTWDTSADAHSRSSNSRVRTDSSLGHDASEDLELGAGAEIGTEGAGSESLSERTGWAELWLRADEVGRQVRGLKDSLPDMDDDRAKLLRQLILARGGNSRSLWTIALSLRASRLAHSEEDRPALRQSLALDTLSLWAPLSFQVGLSAQTPELELHSYILLYPRSFGSFVDWYGAFRPLARTAMRRFRASLERKLRGDPVMRDLCSCVSFQTRLKTPTSAFKKMVKDAKNRDQLYDILGLRVVVTECGPDSTVEHNGGSLGLGEGMRTKVIGRETAGEEALQRQREADAEAAVWRVFSTIKTVAGWRVLPHRVKDYISRPKASGYRSLHASLLHEKTGLHLEVQLRTRSMHVEAETGVASHDQYKAEGRGSTRATPALLARTTPALPPPDS